MTGNDSSVEADSASTSPALVRKVCGVQFYRFVRTFQDLSFNGRHNPFVSVHISFLQVRVVCADGCPEMLLQRIARNRTLHRTPTGMCDKNDQLSVCGNSGFCGESAVHVHRLIVDPTAELPRRDSRQHQSYHKS